MFQYEKLGHREIRLLSLQPGRWDDEVRFDLVHVLLVPEKLPFYEAVSYTWGPQGDLRPVLCQGTRVDVSRKAFSVLRRFRFRDRIRMLWVDAICIIQTDQDEKSRQVPLVDRVYELATSVLIYLGEASRTSNEAMDRISGVSTSTGSEQSKSVVTLFQRQWFSRVWVLQEVALADCALLVCGSKCIAWSCVTDWFSRNVYWLDRYYSDFKPPAVLTYFPTVTKRPSLLQQLHETRSSEASYYGDKVYGILSLLPQEDKDMISVEYCKPFWEVYRDTAKAILEKESSLRLLSGVQLPQSTDELPSWVPDWSVAPRYASLGLSKSYREPFDAGGCYLYCSELDRRLRDVLCCSGIRLDSIKLITRRLESVKQWRESSNEFKAIAIQGSLEGIQPWKVDPPIDPQLALWFTAHAQPSSAIELLNEERFEMAASMADKQESLRFISGRRIMATETGFIGLAPPNAKPTDIVCIFLGAPVPIILRPHSGGNYNLVGECYVYGVMDGEALGHLNDELRALGHRSRPCPGGKSKSSAPLETFKIA